MALDAYNPVGWENGLSGGTALNKTNLRHMDNAIQENRDELMAVGSAVSQLQRTSDTLVSDVNAALHDIQVLDESKFDKDGGTIDGDVDVSGNLDASGDVTCDDGQGNTLSLRQCFTSVSSGKALIAATLTDKGVDTAATDTFATMAYNITKVGKDTVKHMDIALSFVPDEII